MTGIQSINQVLCGDVIQVLHTFPNESVNLIVTSPPYWGLRDYGVEGQIGLEEHPHKYIEKMVQVCRELRRVLRKDGSFYLNMGDTYFGGKGKSGSALPEETDSRDNTLQKGYQELSMDRPQNIVKQDGRWLQSKQLLLIPSRVAIALQEDGWILRNDIVWAKPNHMPSSVRDRLTNGWEHVFHFVKNGRYFYDLDAIRVLHSEKTHPFGKNGSFQVERKSNKCPVAQTTREASITYGLQSKFTESHRNPLGKNPGDIYELTETKPYAVQERTKPFVEVRELPDLEELANYLNQWRKQRGSTIEEVELKLKSQSPHHWFNAESYPTAKDWGKIKELLQFDDEYDEQLTNISLKSSEKNNNPNGKNPSDFWEITTQPFKGAHFAVFPEKLVEPMIKSSCPKDGLVLDPFCGSGTTLIVARKLCRNYIGIDLKPEYCEMARKRISKIPVKLDILIGKKD